MATSSAPSSSAPTAGVLTDTVAAVVPLGRFRVDMVVVCNRGAKTTYRIAYAPFGAEAEDSQYLVFDAPVRANETVWIEQTLHLRHTDVLRVQSGNGMVSFNVFGETGA